MRFKLPREVRLSKSKEIIEVIKKGGVIKEEEFNFFYLFKGGGRFKFGCIVPKRVGNAPKRNRIKRLVREVFRLNQWRLKEGFWMIVLVKESKGEENLKVWWDRLERVWRKAGVIKEDEKSGSSVY